MAKAHLMMLPYPAQGHVTPLMELSHRLVDHGFEVTFVNTEAHHARVLSALPAAGGAAVLGGVHLASIPDELANDEERKDLSLVIDACCRNMPGHLERLITDMEAAGRPKVKWLVCDLFGMGACMEVAKKHGVRVAAFWPASAACLAILLNTSKWIEEGLIDGEGWLERDEPLPLGAGMPPIRASMMPWMDKTGAPVANPGMFEAMKATSKLKKLADVVVCNSFPEAETGALKSLPDILAVGPLFADQEFQKAVGHFLPEDEKCVEWLDVQPDRSVVYVAFGSLTIFDPRQFEELARGLELTGRPFLWVVRPDFTEGLNMAWLAEFRQRVAGTGVITSWCSQQKVLAHRSVACFVSHCGWNSTTEGLRNGVPFLCWPYFCDQFLNRSYVCNVWRTGLPVTPDADGMVTKEELRSKVEQVLGDGDMKKRAWVLKDAARRCIGKSGSSFGNFTTLVNLLGEVCTANSN